MPERVAGGAFGQSGLGHRAANGLLDDRFVHMTKRPIRFVCPAPRRTFVTLS
jgi:hypothetical protein